MHDALGHWIRVKKEKLREQRQFVLLRYKALEALNILRSILFSASQGHKTQAFAAVD